MPLNTRINTRHFCLTVIWLTPPVFKIQPSLFQFLSFPLWLHSQLSHSVGWGQQKLPEFLQSHPDSRSTSLQHLFNVFTVDCDMKEIIVVLGLLDLWNNCLMNSSSQIISQFVLNVWRKVWQTATFFLETVSKCCLLTGPNLAKYFNSARAFPGLGFLNSGLRSTYCWGRIWTLALLMFSLYFSGSGVLQFEMVND